MHPAPTNIGATYCPGFGSRAQTLQILIHGPWVLPHLASNVQLASDLFSVAYTRSYWFGLYYSQSNSWVDYAASLGYATLSIDRLGNGLSDHPDPIVDVQLSYQAEELHQIILQARAGLIPETNTNFNRIVVVGHSLGSRGGEWPQRQVPCRCTRYATHGLCILLPPPPSSLVISYNPGWRRRICLIRDMRD